MAYPSDLPTVTVRHRIVGTDGTPARGGGRVTAVLTGRLWTGQGSVVPTQYTADVQPDGTYELELPPVDHPDIVAGRGEAYLVTEPAATIDTRRPGRVAAEQFHVAPLTEHVGQVVDVSEVVSPRPKPGGGIELVAGPVTDETMAGVIANPNSATALSLKNTIAAEVDGKVDGYIADHPDVATAVADTIEQRDLVTASSVRRIIASPDPNEPLEAGDLLLVYDPPFTAFTDFTEGLGAFTQRYNPGGWAVVDDPTATGGKAVQTPVEGASRRGLSWNIADTEAGRADAEIVGRMKVPGIYSAAGAGLMIRGAGGSGSETAWIATVYNNQLTLARVTDGTWFSGVQPTFNYQPNEWYWIRLRAHQDRVMARAWVDGQPEPTDWLLHVSAGTILNPGWVGLYASGNYKQTWDCIGIGLEGAAAPKEA